MEVFVIYYDYEGFKNQKIKLKADNILDAIYRISFECPLYAIRRIELEDYIEF